MNVVYTGETQPFMLTHNKVYKVLSIEKGWYRIKDDTGEDYLYPPEKFKEEIKNQEKTGMSKDITE